MGEGGRGGEEAVDWEGRGSMENVGQGIPQGIRTSAAPLIQCPILCVCVCVCVCVLCCAVLCCAVFYLQSSLLLCPVIH